jgi:hypothetical protein
MVRYLIVGIIVAIVEEVSMFIDMKKLGLTIYDIWPMLKGLDWVTMAFMFVTSIIVVAILWPLQVYVWIRRITKCDEVQKTEEES